MFSTKAAACITQNGKLTPNFQYIEALMNRARCSAAAVHHSVGEPHLLLRITVCFSISSIIFQSASAQLLIHLLFLNTRAISSTPASSTKYSTSSKDKTVISRLKNAQSKELSTTSPQSLRLCFGYSPKTTRSLITS